jgi:uncharacterized membrane protein
MFMPPPLALPDLLPLLIFPLLMFPPPVPVFPFVVIGVGVLIGVDVVFMVVFDVVFVVVVLPALFVFSLPQPIPKAATASKVRRAKVLRIELSPVTQRVRLLKSWAEASSCFPLVRFSYSSANGSGHMSPAPRADC